MSAYRRFLPLLAGVLLLAGCTTGSVRVRYDGLAAAPEASTFRWQPGMVRDVKADSAYAVVMRCVEEELARKGFSPVPPDAPARLVVDCTVGYALRTAPVPGADSRGGRPVSGAVYTRDDGWRPATVEDAPDRPEQMAFRTIFIAVTDQDGARRLWEATVEKPANALGELSHAEYGAAVARALEFFPVAAERRGLLTALTPGISVEPF